MSELLVEFLNLLKQALLAEAAQSAARRIIDVLADLWERLNNWWHGPEPAAT